MGKLTASDATVGDSFGNSVFISGDTAIVGMSGNDSACPENRWCESGAAYVFHRDLGGTENWGQVAKLTASDASVGDSFGNSVYISGDTAIVGAVFDNDACLEEPPPCNSGSAYIFQRNHGGPENWGQVGKLTASDAARLDRWFGYSVSISGDTAIVGAILDDDAGSESGSAYVFLAGGRCGNGVIKWSEACDDGGELAARDADCTFVECGDGTLNPVFTVSMPPPSEGSRLFAAHCAACHGREGRGNGRAIIALDVRPRDFWEERFRYVSATNGVPTQDDLVQTIRRGRRSGEMPANPQLTGAEVLALADYVRELNRRGWLQRLTVEFGDDEDMEPEDFEEIAEARVTPGKVLMIPWPALDFRADLAVGRELYEAGCAPCHGPTGRGDGLDNPLDELGKPIAVRDLTSGRFRGGTAPEEIFKRIRCGVPGTPMPAQLDFSDEEVWHLIDYVESLAARQW